MLYNTLKNIANNSSVKNFNTYFNSFKNEIQDSIFINNIKTNYLVDLNEIKLDKSKIHLINNRNEKVLLSEILGKNKVVYIDFWASWCAPCRKEMPEAKKISADYDKKIDYIYISIDKNAEKWRAAVIAEGLNNSK